MRSSKKYIKHIMIDYFRLCFFFCDLLLLTPADEGDVPPEGTTMTGIGFCPDPPKPRFTPGDLGLLGDFDRDFDLDFRGDFRLGDDPPVPPEGLLLLLPLLDLDLLLGDPPPDLDLDLLLDFDLRFPLPLLGDPLLPSPDDEGTAVSV